MPPKRTAAPQKTRSRQRFAHMRERILNAATDLINEHGTKGMTLQEVAAAVDLNTTSVTYYFSRKELLAAAVFEQTLVRLEEMAIEASSAATPQERVLRFIALNAELRARVLQGAARPLAKLSDMRTLEDASRVPLMKHYQAIFRRVRGFFGTPDDELHKALLTARTHMLLEVVFWLPIWISQYAIVDFPHVVDRLFNIVANGIAQPSKTWDPQIIPFDQQPGLDNTGGGESFLWAATRLINDAGYRGASVDRIVAELNVTKGSFYHHLDAKDDLVLECFRRSYRRVSQVQTLADIAGGDHWRRLTSAIGTLLHIQFKSAWPLLRTTALQALPVPLRANVVERSNRMALRFAGTLVDGMSEGSMRIFDPLIASQMIMATLNTAYDLRKWAEGQPSEQAIALYASTLVDGLFNDRVLKTFGKPSAENKVTRLTRRNAES